MGKDPKCLVVFQVGPIQVYIKGVFLSDPSLKPAQFDILNKKVEGSRVHLFNMRSDTGPASFLSSSSYISVMNPQTSDGLRALNKLKKSLANKDRQHRYRDAHPEKKRQLTKKALSGKLERFRGRPDQR